MAPSVGRRLRRVPDPRAVDRTIDRLGLMPYRDKKAGVLSQGNRQRLGLAKALIHQPDVLLLDEPTNGLDPAGIAEVRALLQELAENHGVAILLSSHLLGEIAKTATRLGIIHQGRLIEETDFHSLQQNLRDRSRGHPPELGG